MSRPETVIDGSADIPPVADPTGAHVTVVPLPGELALPPRRGERLADLILDPTAAGAPEQQDRRGPPGS